MNYWATREGATSPPFRSLRTKVMNIESCGLGGDAYRGIFGARNRPLVANAPGGGSCIYDYPH